MSKKSNNQSKKQVNWEDVGRLSLWGKQSKSGKPFLSGVLEFEDGEKVSVRLFKNDRPKNDNSPVFYGFAQVPDFKAHLYLPDEEGSSSDSDEQDAADANVPW